MRHSSRIIQRVSEIEQDLRQRGSIKQIFVIQPFIIMYIIGTQMTIPAFDNLELETSCHINMRYSKKYCEEIILKGNNTLKKENKNIQIVITKMYSWQKPIEAIVPLAFALFIGSSKTQYKFRKFFLLLPIIGSVASIIACDMCLYFYLWPVEAIGLARAVIPSLFGGEVMFNVALSLYLAERCDFATKTVRLGTASILMLATVAICHSFSGILFRNVGYSYILAIALTLIAFSFLVGLVMITEKRSLYTLPRENLKRCTCNPYKFLYSLSLLVTKRRRNKRKIIYMVLMLSFLISGASAGESTLLFLYTQYNFNWTVVEYSYYNAFATIFSFIGTLILLPILTKSIKINEFILIFLGSCNKIGSNVILIFTKEPFYLYVASGVMILQCLSTIGIMSISIKIVSRDDLGKMHSLMASVYIISKAVFVPPYSLAVYNRTFDVFPGGMFLTSIGVHGLVLFLCLITFIMYQWELYLETEMENITSDVDMDNLSVESWVY